VLVLGGGSAKNKTPTSPRNLAYLRMRPFASVVHRDQRSAGVEVWRLRYRVRGWNGADRDPVQDLDRALERAVRAHPGVPIVLVGHSMGGRTALYAAGHDAVVGVVGLAPWVEPGDPYEQLADRMLVVAHGDLDRVTDPANTRTLALDAEKIGARVAHFVVVGEQHAMLRRARDWNRLVRDSVRVILGPFIPGESDGGQVAAVIAGSDHVDVPLAGRAVPAVPETHRR
jgi:dienelactone hydrolase